jgi:hypothetical protein
LLVDRLAAAAMDAVDDRGMHLNLADSSLHFLLAYA